MQVNIKEINHLISEWKQIFEESDPINPEDYFEGKTYHACAIALEFALIDENPAKALIEIHAAWSNLPSWTTCPACKNWRTDARARMHRRSLMVRKNCKSQLRAALGRDLLHGL